MSFAAVRCGDRMSGIFLRDAALVSAGPMGVVDDLARKTLVSTAAKVVAIAEARFSLVLVPAPQGEISAWDFYCACVFRNGGICRDGLIGEHVRTTTNACISAMSEELRSLIEMSCSPGRRRDQSESLNRDILTALILAEVDILANEHGRLLQAESVQASDMQLDDYQSREKGASPL